MTKNAFLSELRAALSALPEQEQNERLRFYAEMIDDRMEDGMTEEEMILFYDRLSAYLWENFGTRDFSRSNLLN